MWIWVFDTLIPWLTKIEAIIPLATIFGAVAWIVKRILDRDHIKQIRRPRDRDIRKIEKMMEIFPENERDPDGVLARKIRNSKFNRFGRSSEDLVMIALIAKKDRKPYGFLTAEYIARDRTIFFWYLYHKALDHRRRGEGEVDGKDEETCVKMITILSACADRVRMPLLPAPFSRPAVDTWTWRHLVAEIDTAVGSEALAKVRRFQHFAQRVTGQTTPRVFKVDMPFKMPLHDPDLVHEAVRHEADGWLVYAPRDLKQGGLVVRSGRYYASSDYVSGLVRSIVTSYRHAHDAVYDDYLNDFLVRTTSSIPDPVEFVFDRKRMVAPRIKAPGVASG